jgi:MFS family permease
LLTLLTGFTGLVYEVAWQKYLATLLGSHGEATAAVLAIFLGGLSVGYALFGRITRVRVSRARETEGRARLLLLYGGVEIGIGIFVLVFPSLFGVARALSLAMPDVGAGAGFAFDVLLSALLIGPPTVLMGGTIPILTLGLAGSREASTRVHAWIYGANTAGAFAGALCSAFFLIPALGLDGVLYTLGSLNIMAGIVFGLLDRAGERVEPTYDETCDEPIVRPVQLGGYASVALLAGFAMMALQTTFNRDRKLAVVAGDPTRRSLLGDGDRRLLGSFPSDAVSL